MYTKQSEYFFFRLLRVLSDGKVHTFKALTIQFNCSALYLLKSIRVASRYGIEIDLISGLGVCWSQRFIWINEESIKSYLGKHRELFNVLRFDLLDSSNTYLIENKDSLLKKTQIPVIIAELQTQGRGTRQRSWFSNLGGCLTFSFLWKFNHGVKHISTLSLVLGVCLVRVLQRLLLTSIYLKWPNDILFHGKKFAGILVECRTINHSIEAVIGIGINVKLTPNLKDLIDYPVTDLCEITGKNFDRNHILVLLLNEFYDALNIFEINGFHPFRDEWESYHAFHGKPVVLNFSDGTSFEGNVDGIRDDGSLVLTTDSEQKAFGIGEISLKASSWNAFCTRN